MPLSQRGPKTLLITTGVFLFIEVLVVVATAQVMLFALFVPVLYAVFSDQVHRWFTYFLAAIPVTFAVAPGFIEGVVLYAPHRKRVSDTPVLEQPERGMAIFVPSCLVSFLFVLSVGSRPFKRGSRSRP